jgi:hypothetical protein
MNNANLVIFASILVIVGLAFLMSAGQAFAHVMGQRHSSSPLHVEGEQFSASKIEVGQNITVSVELESAINRNITIYPIPILQSTNGLTWSVLENHTGFILDSKAWRIIDVSEEKVLLYPGETRPFNYTIQALKAGSYHIDSAFEYVVDSPDFADSPSLAVGRGNTIVVAGDSVSPFTMRSPTASGNYLIELSWNKGNEESSNSTSLSFYLAILDARGFPQDAVSYDFIVRDASTDITIQRFLNQQVDELGQAQHNVTLSGSIPDGILTDVIIRSAGRLPVLLDDRATFEIVVVPESPIALLILAASLAMVIGLYQYNRRGKIL